MPLFRKRKNDFVDPEARSPELGLKYKDLQVMGELMKHGADLTQPRHVVFYSYGPSATAAKSIAREGRARGLECDVREPLPEYPDKWAVVCETHTVASPEFIRDTTDFFESVAERHGGEYDGWEASA